MQILTAVRYIEAGDICVMFLCWKCRQSDALHQESTDQ